MICQQKQARSAISDVLGIGVLFLTLLALTACQTERTVSLEEAKQITATFDDSTFTPPPRTISDITEFLDKHATTGSEALKAMQVRADSEPPAGGSAPGSANQRNRVLLAVRASKLPMSTIFPSIR